MVNSLLVFYSVEDGEFTRLRGVVNKFNGTLMATTKHGGKDEPKLSSKERYEKLLQTAKYNTGGPETPMPPGVRRPSLLGIASGYGRYDRMDRAYAAAIQNGDLLLWKGRDGRARVTPVDPQSLEDLISTERGREDTCIELVERAEELLEAEI